jgi:deoxyribodipyrimidine photolyase-related protein
VTRTDALIALKSFIEERLVKYEIIQDAMWTKMSRFLHHSLISSSLNVKLLNPRRVIAAAVRALKDARADWGP